MSHNFASIKRLTRTFGISDDAAEQIREWANPNAPHDAMTVINFLIGGYGVECIQYPNTIGMYDRDYLCAYVNMGDAYTPTIVYIYATRTFRVTSWSSLVKRDRRFDSRG
jgi:hypothetical protein